jgi:hypothetical protein
MKISDALAGVFLVMAAIIIALPISGLMRTAGLPTIS